jgi:hypothetical protein
VSQNTARRTRTEHSPQRGLGHCGRGNNILDMSPPHGARVLPAARLTTTGCGMSAGTPSGRTMRRARRALVPRTGRALAVWLTLAAIAMPAALLASQDPALAATGRRVAQNQVSVAITDMTPQQAAPGTTITVAGTVTNSSRQSISNLSVELLASRMPVSTSTELRPGSTDPDDPATTPVPGGSWEAGGPLQAGGTARWSVRVKANSIGMTTFGVYPLTVQAQTAQLQLGATTTYLPYVPARKGADGKSIPAPAKIAWVLPLIDKPLLDQPWQRSCAGTQARALAASLGSGGRLGELVAAGGDPTGTVDAYSAATGSGQAAQDRAVRSQQTQSLSSYDGVTWAVDPALLANVKALTTCGSLQPRWAAAARSWLAELRQVTAAEPMFLTPYGDPDVAALADTRLSGDVKKSIDLGQDIGQQILHRNLGSPPATVSSAGAQSEAAAIAWPPGGIAGYPTTEPLVANGVQTLLLSQSALPAEDPTVLRVLNDVGGYLNILLANEPLTRLLSAAGSAGKSTAGPATGGSAFATAQDFLAQTALAAQQNQPGAPIIVAPPQRWDPATGLTTELLAETASAPWLSPVSLTSLTAAKHIPQVPSSAFADSAARLGKYQLRKLAAADGGILQLDNMAAHPDSRLFLAVATIESSAWQGRSRKTARAMLRTVMTKIGQQERGVQIFAEPRVTLGGLKGSVPVSIDNRLGYAVQVRLKLSYSTATGVKITPDPGELTVQAHTAVTVRLHVQATEVGSTALTLSLQNQGGQPLLAQAQSMTVEATQVGVLGVIICAAALGVLLIAYAARAVRRGHPPGDAGDPVDPGPVADQGGDHRTEPAEPDTVMAERTELGTAGAPGP